jgi:hypothetical protein
VCLCVLVIHFMTHIVERSARGLLPSLTAAQYYDSVSRNIASAPKESFRIPK